MTAYTYIGPHRFPLPAQQGELKAEPAPAAPKKRRASRAKLEVSSMETDNEAPLDGATDNSLSADAQ